MLKEKADLEMMDVGTSQTMQGNISDQVKNAVATALKQKAVDAPPSSECTNSYSSCLQVNPLKGKRKDQDPNRRESGIQEGSTHDILLGKNAFRKARKGGKEEELHQQFQKDEALKNPQISVISEQKFNVGKPSTYPN
jgi:hypothetical protein